MNRTVYLGVFVGSVLALALGALFLCAAITMPERWLLAILLLAVGAVGAGWSAYAYRKWLNVQPAALAARITDLAAAHDGEVAVSQVMSALDVPASVAQAALDELDHKGQCHRERRGDQVYYVFPAFQEHKVTRKCPYCGSTFPVKQAMHTCPNCGGNLELIKQ
ncbi:MAG: TFIIB-type zinc ribbon-containing protein [Chloroflexi bacterium]|nr:TFIIB-type zinc ribbon-containing protein [Chloroflexota bacterium]MBU1748540.1 TFIIB-type zinc ribbon-containing protein [Chloroflexota bacterium]